MNSPGQHFGNDRDELVEGSGYVIYINPHANNEQLSICNYCKPRIHSNELPCLCVLNHYKMYLYHRRLINSMLWVHNSFSAPSACYDLACTLVKFPVTIPSKSVRGPCLLLPMKRTLETLNQVELSKTALPDPEL